MKLLLGILIFTALIAGAIYYFFNLENPVPEINVAAEYCLDQLSLEANKIDWETAVITITQDTDVPNSFLWKKFTALDSWKIWNSPWHVKTVWADTPGWTQGNILKETLDLGFPLGVKDFEQKIIVAESESKIVWTSNTHGINSCHAWYFIPLKDGRSRIINSAVFKGRSIGYAKPFIFSPWLKLFLEDVNGLIREAAHGS